MRNYLLILLLLFVFGACKDRIICPAFQSTYILDDSTRMAYFSYAWKLDEPTREKFIASLTQPADTLDSLAVGGTSSTMETYYTHVSQYIQPVKEVRRSKYGIIKYEPMWLKNYNMKTSPMENVSGPAKEIPVEEEPIDIGEFVASDFEMDSILTTDSTSLAFNDSIQQESESFVPSNLTADAATEAEASGPKYLYRYDPNGQNNVEQEYYNKYFGRLLVYQKPKEPETPEVPVTPLDSLATQGDIPIDTTQAESGRGFFRGRKNRNTGADETGTDPDGNEEEEGGNNPEGGSGN